MRCAVVLLALAAFGAALPQLPKQRAVDQDLLKKQQDVIYLLQHISQPIPNEQLRMIGNTYDIKANYQQYENPILVKYYVGAVEAGLVQPQNTVYSNSISHLRKEVAVLHRILVGAKNYQTFVNTAAWARVHVNEEQYVKAFIGAVLKRQDTQGVTLPPLYEIVPHYYFDSRIIQEAQDIAAQQAGHVEQHDQVIIPVNYTSHLPHDEHHLSYFTQDVGLSNYYAYVNLAGYLLQEQQQYERQGQVQYQQQGVGQKNHIGQGARYYYHHQQLLAHYELNRLSNGLGPIYDTDYTTVKAPYQPHLRYLNGLEFPSRPEYHHFGPAQQKLVHLVKTLHNRLFAAIDSGYVLTPQSAFLSIYQPQGLNILGELIEGTGHSINPRYYGSLQAAARQLLGNAPEVQHIYDYTPSVLELGQIAVRDPAFYQLYKKIIHLFYRYQNSLPAYQYNDVLLPGVTIQNVQITQLTTLFNDYYVNLDSAVVHQHKQQQQQQQQGQQEQDHIKAQLKRLDHKPYEYHITVQSETNVPNVVVRTYLGPKYDYNGQPIDISEHRHKFVQLDQFKTTLQQGQNIITRHSHQAPGQSFDYPSVQQIKQHVHGAARSQEPLYITEPHQIYSFPARLSLPKGTHEGYPFQLFVVISQPGQQEVHYGPVVPDQFQTYQHNEYQVVGSQEYPQQIQQQSGKTIGVKQTVEVIPEQLLIQQGNQAVKDHYANLYTQHHHGQYPFSQYSQVGQGQEQSVYGVPSQYGHQGPQGQPGQYVQQGQYPYGQGYYQGQQGQQGQQQYQQQYPGQHKVPSHVQTSVPPVQDVQGMQRLQTVPGVQGVQGVPTGVPGVQTPGVLGSQTGKYHTTYQGQSQQAQGHGVGYYGSGQYHAGGYQGISGQPQHVQDVQVNEYYQNKQIGEIIGGAISLDGKPLGYPLDRCLTDGALSVPNVHVQTVYVYHEGQSTNDIYSQ